ncbi:MAG TPA: DUF5804 family protein, partial [Methanocorpusculum sp.]|nr:DUF5804 family protein [Methanocorpusculum sp.]
ETSRHVLRFYHPKNMKWGVRIEVATVSSALSLLSELKWYSMRYMSRTLIEEPEHAVYLTPRLAKKVYENREVVLSNVWEYTYRTAVLASGEVLDIPMGLDTPTDTQISFSVWGTEEEVP